MHSRTLLLVLLTGLAGLSGCLSDGTDAPDDVPLPAPTQAMGHQGGTLVPVDAPAVGTSFLTGLDATEPTIGVTSGGTVWMTATTCTDVPDPLGCLIQPALVASRDQGRTWVVNGPQVAGFGTHATSNDPTVYVDPATDRVFMSDILPPSCIWLSWSNDDGATWTENPYACGNNNVNDHQTMVAATPRLLTTVGYPNIVYTCFNNVAAMSCTTSLDGGLTFGPQVPVEVDPVGAAALCSALTGHLKADHAGRVFLPTSECSTQVSAPIVYVTEDDGLTWAKHTITNDPARFLPPNEHEVVVAVDAADNLYATWPDQDGYLWFSRSPDHGTTWLDPINVTLPGVTATAFNALAAGDDGRVAFAYLGTTIEGGYAGKGTGNAGLNGDLLGQPDLPEWENATWNAYLGIILDAWAEEPVVQTATGNDPADPLARALCGRTRCHGMNDFIDLVVDAEGRPWASFVDTCTRACINDTTVHNDVSVGLAVTLRSGPALRGDGLLAELPRPDDDASA